MKVGIISDTHDRLPTFRAALERLRNARVEAIFHAGDFIAPFAAKLIAPDALEVPLHCVYGNNDGERVGLKKMLPDVQDGPYTIELAGKTILMDHFIDWLKPEAIAAADIVITGHTHQVVNEHRDGKLFLNPGECCGWVTDRCTCAILDLASGTAEILDIPG